MSAHLPECPRPMFLSGKCICNQLRACEARVIDGFLASDTMKVIRSGESEHGFHAGLDAAREKLAGIEHWASYSPDGDVWSCWSSDPLAAIDALKGNHNE